MNAAVRERNESLYIAGIVRDEQSYTVVARCLWKDGSFRCYGIRMSFVDLASAKRKVRDLIKMKVKRKDAVRIDITELPKKALLYLTPDFDKEMTAEDLAKLVNAAERERYVVFKDVTGLEDWFDEGVEYCAEVSEDDPDFLTVIDRYGEPRGVSVERLESVSHTEASEELDKLRA